MASGDFTKQEAEASEEALKEIMSAFPKKKAGEFIGHFNDVFLFIQAAKNQAPSEKK